MGTTAADIGVKRTVRRWSHAAQWVRYKPIGNQVSLPFCPWNNLFLITVIAQWRKYYIHLLWCQASLALTVYLAKDFIHCPFIPAIVNHLCLCIFMPKPAINLPAMLLMVRNCQVPFLLFIYFCLGNEDTVNTCKWYSIYCLAYAWLLRASDLSHSDTKSTSYDRTAYLNQILKDI